MFSLCYLPTAGRLTITIIKARNLKAMDITGASGKNLFNAQCGLVSHFPSKPQNSSIVNYQNVIWKEAFLHCKLLRLLRNFWEINNVYSGLTNSLKQSPLYKRTTLLLLKQPWFKTGWGGEVDFILETGSYNRLLLWHRGKLTLDSLQETPNQFCCCWHMDKTVIPNSFQQQFQNWLMKTRKTKLNKSS